MTGTRLGLCALSVCLRAIAADRSVEDGDSHACSFTGVPNRSLGEDLENIIYWLAPNDDFGYMVPITMFGVLTDFCVPFLYILEVFGNKGGK